MASGSCRSRNAVGGRRGLAGETVEVPGETVVVEKEVIKTVEVPGETVVVEKEVIKTVEVVKSVPVEVIKEVEVVGDRWVRNTAGKLVENPQYGGTVVGLGTEHPSFSPLGADPLTAGDAWHVAPLYETLLILDWAKGPAGTGEWDNRYRLDATKIPDQHTGSLAESWEQPDPETTIFHLRKGVYFHDLPPVNGREVVLPTGPTATVDILVWATPALTRNKGNSARIPYSLKS